MVYCIYWRGLSENNLKIVGNFDVIFSFWSYICFKYVDYKEEKDLSHSFDLWLLCECPLFNGTVSWDFLHPVFFINQFILVPLEMSTDRFFLFVAFS